MEQIPTPPPQASIPTPPPTPVPPPPPKNTVRYLGILLIVIGLGSLGFWVYKNYSASSPTAVVPVMPTPTPFVSPNPTAKADDLTANWQTYTSVKAGFSFKYPISLPIETSAVNSQCDTCVEDIRLTPNPAAGGSSIAVILVFKDPRIKTLEDYKNVIVKGDSSIVNVQDAMVGPEKAISYKLSGGIPPLPIIEYVVVKNNYYYVIRLVDSTETNRNLTQNQSTFNQILSTFKFLGSENPTGSGTSCQYKGKTYKAGEAVPSGDNCNSCSCDNGQVACTAMACL